MAKEFGEYLKKLREDRGLTLRDVEREAKISNAYLSQIERGERGIPNFKVLSRLSKAYGVAVAKLMEIAEQEEKRQEQEPGIRTPDAQFISRGYEQLSDDQQMALQKFLQHLLSEKKHKK